MSKIARTKLHCYEIAEFQSGKYVNGLEGKPQVWEVCTAKKFKFQVVSASGDPENDLYSAISGGTNMELSTINSSLFDKFVVGKNYYADLSPAE